MNREAPVYDPNLKLNEQQKLELQKRYNRPGEEDEDE
jgi:hypothetical protein